MYLRKKQSIFIAIGTLAVFFIAGGAYIALSRQGPPITPPATTDPNAAVPVVGVPEASSFVLENFHRSEMQDGKKVWEVSALRGTYVPATNTAHLEAPRLLFYRSSGEVVELSAQRAVVTIAGTRLTRAELEGNVRLGYDSKTTISTDRAVYDRTADTITAPGTVSISSAQLDIVGQELTALIAARRFTLARNVSSTVKRTALNRRNRA